jgi:general secretion pathway protein G
MKTRKRQVRHFFTLMEMLVVVGIIMLIAAIAMPAYFKIQDNASKAAARAQIKSFETAIAAFRMDMGRFPRSLDELMTSTGDRKWNGPYLGNTTFIPKDPWGNPYLFQCPGSGDRPFEITSYGSDGTAGGSGSGMDISNYLEE